VISDFTLPALREKKKKKREGRGEARKGTCSMSNRGPEFPGTGRPAIPQHFRKKRKRGRRRGRGTFFRSPGRLIDWRRDPWHALGKKGGGGEKGQKGDLKRSNLIQWFLYYHPGCVGYG